MSAGRPLYTSVRPAATAVGRARSSRQTARHSYPVKIANAVGRCDNFVKPVTLQNRGVQLRPDAIKSVSKDAQGNIIIIMIIIDIVASETTEKTDGVLASHGVGRN